MKPTAMSRICSLALAAMIGAGVIHWWSIQSFVATHADPRPAAAKSVPAVVPPTPAPDAHLQKFYQELCGKMKDIELQNRDLRDQIAETNRDVMNLQFRVDTHSASFRPMPVSEEPMEDPSDKDFDVPPPRALPVSMPSNEPPPAPPLASPSNYAPSWFPKKP